MHPPAPVLIGLRHTTGRALRHWRNLEAKPVDQTLHFLPHVAARGDDKRFCHGAGRDQKVSFGFQCRDASGGFRLAEHDSHERGRIHSNHSGKPSSPYRKSWLRAALGPATAFAAAEPRTARNNAPRDSLLGTALTGTSCTAGWPWRVRMTSSPASARRTSSVNCPLASLTDTCMISCPFRPSIDPIHHGLIDY